MNKNSIKILVVASSQKEEKMSFNKRPYYTISVGDYSKENSSCDFKDNNGENISDLNKNFCELTAYYWAWKNLKCDIIGIEHYRRYLGNLLTNKNKFGILAESQIDKYLKNYDAILPYKEAMKIGRFKLVSAYNQYCVNHYKKDLDKTLEIIKEYYPDYYQYCNVLNDKKIYTRNILITRKDIFDDLCAFEFGVLFKLKDNINISKYPSYQKRIFGFLSERLLNIFLQKEKIRIRRRYLIDTSNISFKGKIKKFIAPII